MAGWQEWGWQEELSGEVKLSQGFRGVTGLLAHLPRGRILQVEATGSTKALR